MEEEVWGRGKMASYDSINRPKVALFRYSYIKIITVFLQITSVASLKVLEQERWKYYKLVHNLNIRFKMPTKIYVIPSTIIRSNPLLLK